MIRYTLPLIVMAGPSLAHGLHAPTTPAWHGVAHLAASAGIAVLAGAAGIAVFRNLREGRRRGGRR